MKLRSATAADLDALLRLEVEGFDHTRWSRDAWAAELAGPDRRVTVMTDGEDVIGAATFSVLADVAELLRIVVTTSRRGGGIGRLLVDDGVAWACERGANRMLLEVEESNAAARALYDRVGFATIARRDNYYGTGRHALVMEKEWGSD